MADLGEIADLGKSVFGSSGSSSGSGTTTGTRSTTATEQLDIGSAGITKLIQDVLGSAGGLAEIFSGQQNAGIFNSSVSAQAAGNLAASVIGELVKLQAKKTTTQATEEETTSTSKSKEKDGGLLGAIKDIF